MSENIAHKEFKDKLRNFLRDDVAGPRAVGRTSHSRATTTRTSGPCRPPPLGWNRSGGGKHRAA